MVKKLSTITLENDYTLTELMERFLDYKKADGLADRTLKDYKHQFKWFLNYSSNEVNFKVLCNEVLSFLTERSKLSAYSYNSSYKDLKCFFNWIVDQEYLEKNPVTFLKLHSKREEGRIVNIPPTDIKKIFNCMDLKQYCEFRDYIIICLMLDTGIRPNECFQITLPYLDFSNNTITVSSTIAKTRRQRVLPVSKMVMDLIQKLISLKPKEWNNELVFTGHCGGQITASAFGRRFKIYGDRCGVYISAYELRHSFATQFLENNGNVFTLQRILGHTTLNMTRRYVHPSQEYIAKEHQSATPLNNIIQRNTRVVKLFK